MNENIQSLLPSVLKSIHSVLNAKSDCVLALAGGNTPKPFYQSLSEADLPWHKIKLTLTDERWVPIDHVDSNEAMIKTAIGNVIDENNFIGLKNSEANINKGCELTHKTLQQLAPKLDLVILGMGEDGHFASIFPDVENIKPLLNGKNENNCLAVAPEGKQQRISLTYSYLLSARVIYLLISGEVKKQIIEDIEKKQKGYQAYPISALLNQTTCPVEIYWNP